MRTCSHKLIDNDCVDCWRHRAACLEAEISRLKGDLKISEVGRIHLPEVVARLEAAEACLRTCHTENIHGQCMLDCRLCKDLKAWRKVAGK